MGQGRGIVGSVAGHGDQMPFCLEITDHLELAFRRCLCQEIVHAGLCCNRRRGGGIIPRNHNGFDAHLPQVSKFFLHPLLDDIFQVNYAEDFMVFGNHQRGAALLCDALHDLAAFCGINAPSVSHILLHGFCGAFADFVAVIIYAAHAGFGSKRGERHIFVGKGPATNAICLFCQHDHTPSLRCLIRQRGELGGIGQFRFTCAVDRNERGCLTVAQGDGARFIQHQNIHIPCRFNGSAAHGQHICLVQPAHTGNADCREQCADGGRRKADKQSDQRCDGSRIINPRLLRREDGVSVQ